MGVSIDNLLDGMAGIAYLTDTSGRIVNLGRQNWNAFASANNGPALINGEAVLGRPVFDCVAGDEVRACYQRCIDAILGERLDSIRIMSRCDSPTFRRQLWIIMRPVQGRKRVAGLLVQVLVVSEEMRPPVDLFDFPAQGVAVAKHPTLPLLAMCSYCQNVRYPADSRDDTGQWMPAEEYYRRGGDSAVRVSHGLCPNCFALTEATLPH